MVALVIEQVGDHSPQRIGPRLASGAEAGERTLERRLVETCQPRAHLALDGGPALGDGVHRRELVHRDQRAWVLAAPALQPDPFHRDQMRESIAQRGKTLADRTQELLRIERGAGLKLPVARPVVVVEQLVHDSQGQHPTHFTRGPAGVTRRGPEAGLH